MGRLKNRALDARVVALADSGLGNCEIAEIIGSTRSAVESRLRSVGYKRTQEQKSGIYKRAAVPNSCLPPHKSLEEREAEFAAKFDERDELANLEYVSGYTSGDCNVLVRCKICGHEFTRWTKRLIHKTNPTTFCPQCGNADRPKRKQKRKPKPKRRLILRTKKCAWCGDAFMAEGKEIYCTRDCYKEANKKQIKERAKRLGLDDCIARAKYYGVPYEYGITLDKVIKRDKNICHICGGECDRDDKAYGAIGPKYPTRDHVIPIAKGGPHYWRNVKLAHFQCNSEKGAKLDKDDGGRDAERFAS